MRGKVVLIGAGPGDPLLMTLKGKEYIELADCIVYDRLATSELLAYAKSDCELIYVGKENHHHTMKQEDINKLLAKKVEQYKLVIRLKGGDPYVFGRGGEEAIFLKQKGIEVEVVPGISSVIAALGDAGIPITHRGLSNGFQVVSAHSRKDMPADIDYTKMLDDDVTYLFLMGLSHTEEITKGLMAAGKAENTPVAVISSGTTARQKKVVGNLGNIHKLTVEEGLISPAIIVVGKVVTLSSQLNFFESRPLFGKKYIVPYVERFCFSYDKGVVPPKQQGHFDSELERELRNKGADICSVKVGSIEPIAVSKNILLNSLESEWIIFTSPNGVNAFLWNLRENGLDIRAIKGSKIAVVGNKTAEALERVAIRPDLVPEKQNGKALCTCLLDELSSPHNTFQNVRVTLYGAEESNNEICELLSKRWRYEKIVCYENALRETESPGYIETDWACYDGIFFTSGSSVKRFMRLSGGVLPDTIYSIGPMCSQVIRQEAQRNCIEAKTASYKGLIDIVQATGK